MNGNLIAVDLSVIEDLAAGDPAVLAELIETFDRHMAQGIAGVRTAIGLEAFTQAALLVHTCIGFTATLGITALIPTLRELERASKAGQPADINRWLVRWQSEFEQVRQSLLARIKSTCTS
jgi:HPt (histidine-containing phosphotransfer) domain-containing protein